MTKRQHVKSDKEEIRMDNELIEFRKDLQKRIDRISLRLSESIRMKDELDCVITVALLEEYAKGIFNR